MPDFLIQRYPHSNWPFIRGELPFIVTGPRFTAYTTSPRIEHEWRFRPSFVSDIRSAGDSADRLSREIVAELLLREGIVQALWVTNGERSLPEDQRWDASIAQLADEIPAVEPLADWVIELLSGMSDPSYPRGYLAETGLELHPVPVPGGP